MRKHPGPFAHPCARVQDSAAARLAARLSVTEGLPLPGATLAIARIGCRM